MSDHKTWTVLNNWTFFCILLISAVYLNFHVHLNKNKKTYIAFHLPDFLVSTYWLLTVHRTSLIWIHFFFKYTLHSMNYYCPCYYIIVHEIRNSKKETLKGQSAKHFSSTPSKTIKSCLRILDLQSRTYIFRTVGILLDEIMVMAFKEL